MECVTEVTYRILKLGDSPSRSKIVHFNNLKLYQRKKNAANTELAGPTVRREMKRPPIAPMRPEGDRKVADETEEDQHQKLGGNREVDSSGEERDVEPPELGDGKDEDMKSSGEEVTDAPHMPPIHVENDPRPSRDLAPVPDEAIPEVQIGSLAPEMWSGTEADPQTVM